MRCRVLVSLAVLLIFGGLVQADTVLWEAPAYHHRIALTLPATAGGTLKCGLVITGKDFFRWTGFPCPSVKALMLGGPQGRIPLQVEERDGTGRLQTPGNGRLDDDDQILFVVEMGPAPLRLHLYYDGPDAPGLPVATSVTATPGQPLQLASEALSLAIRGGGLDDTSQNVKENHGRGSIVTCTWQGETVVDQNASIAAYFPQTLASGPGAPKWSDPVVLISGPARTVVEVHCKGFQVKTGDKVTFQGDITHYISMWNGAPCVDFEEDVTYTGQGYDFNWSYGGGSMVGKDLEASDRMILPLLGQVYPVKLPTREEIKARPYPLNYQQFYNTWVPEEGWFAFQDTAEKTGMATFYEPLSEIRERDTWGAYQPAWNPEIYIRTTPGPLEVRLNFQDRALRCRNEWRRALRYTFLRDEKPEDIQLMYHLWGVPLDQRGKVEAPEERAG